MGVCRDVSAAWRFAVSRSRAKGTAFETELLERLRRLWPAAERAGTTKGPNDYGDYLHVGGWLIEAKKQDKWHLPAWIKTIQRKVSARKAEIQFVEAWALIFAADRRTVAGTFVVQPLDQWIAQVESANLAHRMLADMIEPTGRGDG